MSRLKGPFVNNGYSKLIMQIQDECVKAGVKIMFNSPVSKINHDNNQVVVTTPNGDIQGKRCVCAIPGGVVKKHMDIFLPVLTQRKQEALEEGIGPIHFACAYISRVSESVQNAYASGIRASKAVIAELKQELRPKLK